MIAELRPLFLAVVPHEDSGIRPATRQEVRQRVEVSQGSAGAGHKDAGTEAGFAPALRMEMTKGWTAAEDGGRPSAHGAAAHSGGSWARRMLDATDTTQFMLSKRPESLGLQSCQPWMLAREPGPGVGQVSRNTELFLHAGRDRVNSTTQGGETPLCPSPLWL